MLSFIYYWFDWTIIRVRIHVIWGFFIVKMRYSKKEFSIRTFFRPLIFKEKRFNFLVKTLSIFQCIVSNKLTIFEYDKTNIMLVINELFIINIVVSFHFSWSKLKNSVLLNYCAWWQKSDTSYKPNFLVNISRVCIYCCQFVVNEMYFYFCLRVFPLLWQFKIYQNRRHYHLQKYLILR